MFDDPRGGGFSNQPPYVKFLAVFILASALSYASCRIFDSPIDSHIIHRNRNLFQSAALSLYSNAAAAPNVLSPGVVLTHPMGTAAGSEAVTNLLQVEMVSTTVDASRRAVIVEWRADSQIGVDIIAFDDGGKVAAIRRYSHKPMQ